jgi:hypothetical protein
MINNHSTFLSYFFQIFLPKEYSDSSLKDKKFMIHYLTLTHLAIFVFSLWRFFHYTGFSHIPGAPSALDIVFFIIFYLVMTLPFIFANTSLLRFWQSRKKVYSIYHLYRAMMGAMLGIVIIFLSLPILELVDIQAFDICGCYIATIN